VPASAAAYGWNDPAGIIVALCGWSLHDRQTTLFTGWEWQRGIVDGRTLYDDIDGRAGFYAGFNANYRGTEFRALRYDNRGTPPRLLRQSTTTPGRHSSTASACADAG
jgi:hypothetical protein